MKFGRIYTITFLLLLCFHVGGYAQKWLERLDYRLELGATASTITNVQSVKSSYNYSARIGGSFSIPLLNSPINFTSGLFITQKGLKIDIDEDNRLKAKPTYLEMPLCLSYRIDFNEEQTMFVDFGGYGAVGVVGKFDFFGDGFSGNEAKDIFRLQERPINRFDAGLTASVLYEYMSFAFRIGGSFGLVDAVNNNPNVSYWHSVENKHTYNMQLFLNVGYRFFYY